MWGTESPHPLAQAPPWAFCVELLVLCKSSSGSTALNENDVLQKMAEEAGEKKAKRQAHQRHLGVSDDQQCFIVSPNLEMRK